MEGGKDFYRITGADAVLRRKERERDREKRGKIWIQNLAEIGVNSRSRISRSFLLRAAGRYETLPSDHYPHTFCFHSRISGKTGKKIARTRREGVMQRLVAQCTGYSLYFNQLHYSGITHTRLYTRRSLRHFFTCRKISFIADRAHTRPARSLGGRKFRRFNEPNGCVSASGAYVAR